MKKCTPLWREAHFQVKMLIKTPRSDHFWKLRRRKSACRCGAKHIPKSKCKNTRGSDHFWKLRSKKCTLLWRSTFRSQNVQNTPCSDHFWKLRCRKSARCCGAKHISKSKVEKAEGYGALLDVQMCLSRGRRKGLCTLSKVSKTREGFCGISKNDGRHLQRCISRGRRSTKDMFIRHVRRSGR